MQEAYGILRPRNEDLSARDKSSLDITWMRDESLEDGSNLPPPDVIEKLVEDLQSALEQFRLVLADLEEPVPDTRIAQ